MLNLAVGLSERGYSVDIVTACAGGELSGQVPACARHVPLNAKRTATAVIPLARYLRRETPSGMISALTHANIVALAARFVARSRTSVVVTEHRDLAYLGSTRPSARDSCNRAVLRFVYPKAAGVVAVSEELAQSVQRVAGLPPGAVSTIHNPVLVDNILDQSSTVPNHPWFDRDRRLPVILAAGRLTPIKRFDVLIHAFAQTIHTGEARLVILGEGESRASLERLVVRLHLSHLVSMPGFVSNPFSF